MQRKAYADALSALSQLRRELENLEKVTGLHIVRAHDDLDMVKIDILKIIQEAEGNLDDYQDIPL